MVRLPSIICIPTYSPGEKFSTVAGQNVFFGGGGGQLG